MFRKTQPRQLGAFSEASSYLSRRLKKVLTDKGSWHNAFYKEVTSVIDEDILIKLYDEGNGRPNLSICLMVAIMILKENEGRTPPPLPKRKVLSVRKQPLMFSRVPQSDSLCIEK